MTISTVISTKSTLKYNVSSRPHQFTSCVSALGVLSVLTTSSRRGEKIDHQRFPAGAVSHSSVSHTCLSTPASAVISTGEYGQMVRSTGGGTTTSPMTFSVHELPSIYATCSVVKTRRQARSRWWNWKSHRNASPACGGVRLPSTPLTGIHRPTIRATHSNMSLPRFYWELIRKKVE